jgi:hypothetical protein
MPGDREIGVWFLEWTYILMALERGAPCWIAPHFFISLIYGLPPTHYLLHELYKCLQIFAKVRNLVMGPNGVQTKNHRAGDGGQKFTRPDVNSYTLKMAAALCAETLQACNVLCSVFAKAEITQETVHICALLKRLVGTCTARAGNGKWVSAVKCLSESLPYPEVGVCILPRPVKWCF